MNYSLANLENCLLAGAAGDCIGGPYEGHPARVDRQLPQNSWRISDDTILSLATCRAIGTVGSVDPQAIADEFLIEFRNGRIPGLGASTLKALRDLNTGAHWALAGRKGEFAAGNGAAMRIAPLAFFLDTANELDRKTIRDVCRITHHNDEAYVAALAVIIAIQTGWRNARLPIEEQLTTIAASLPDTNVRDTIHRCCNLPVDASPTEAISVTGCSGYAAESVPLALFIASAHPDLQAAIMYTIRCGGDTDTIASLVGHVLGAQGAPLPKHWLDQLPCCKAIRDAVLMVNRQSMQQ